MATSAHPPAPAPGTADGPRSPGRVLDGAVARGSWSVRRAVDLSDVRHAVESSISDAAPDDAARVSLVVSELATNALKFGSGTATVGVQSVSSGVDGWFVDVHDTNLREYPRALRVDPFRSGQQGLVLVSTLCPTWGWYVDSWTRRKHVWAVVERSAVAA